MAESKENVVTFGLSGLVGKMLVFKKRGDKTFVSSRPKFDSNRVLSEAQLAVQEKFKLASIYATNAIKDPDVKEAYEAAASGNQSAYNRAFKDAQLAPKFIGDLKVDGYEGAIGNQISAKVIDDFKVEAVLVSIKNSSSVVIEEGTATLAPDQVSWMYTAQTENASLTGTTITFKAYDLPGNETVKQVIL